jgi:hypothetical protein
MSLTEARPVPKKMAGSYPFEEPRAQGREKKQVRRYSTPAKAKPAIDEAPFAQDDTDEQDLVPRITISADNHRKRAVFRLPAPSTFHLHPQGRGD